MEEPNTRRAAVQFWPDYRKCILNSGINKMSQGPLRTNPLSHVPVSTLGLLYSNLPSPAKSPLFSLCHQPCILTIHSLLIWSSCFPVANLSMVPCCLKIMFKSMVCMVLPELPFPAPHSQLALHPAALLALTLQVKNTKWLHASLTWFFLQPLIKIQLSYPATDHFSLPSHPLWRHFPLPPPQNPSSFPIDITIPSCCPLYNLSQFFHNIYNNSVYLVRTSVSIKDIRSFLSTPGT